MSVLRTLKREIRKLISKKPKNLNETRAILLHLEGMKISEIAKILQVHKSTVYRWINEFQRGRKMPIPQGKKRKKKEGKREGNKGRRNTRKNHMGSKGLHRGEV